jgi:hypothetical protein
MSKQKAKESILKAHDLKRENTGIYRQFNEKVREEIKIIKDDTDLSEEGRAKRIAQVQETRGKELLQLAYRRHREYRALLADARQNAEAVIYSDIPKPDQTKIDRFDEAFRKLKTELMLARDGKSAAQKLTQFIEGVDERYLHHKISESFGELSSSVLAIDDSAAMRGALSKQYDSLNASYESPDAEEARSSLEVANDMENSQFFLDAVVGAARDTLGTQYSSFLNNTESYFTRHEDERPVMEKPQESKKKAPDLGFSEEQIALIERKVREAREAKEAAGGVSE